MVLPLMSDGADEIKKDIFATFLALVNRFKARLQCPRQDLQIHLLSFAVLTPSDTDTVIPIAHVPNISAFY
jgi:hypothetical protein